MPRKFCMLGLLYPALPDIPRHQLLYSLGVDGPDNETVELDANDVLIGHDADISLDETVIRQVAQQREIIPK